MLVTEESIFVNIHSEDQCVFYISIKVLLNQNNKDNII